jgi:hypothetical protein
MQLVLQRLEGALNEIKELRAENRAIKSSSLNGGNRTHFVVDSEVIKDTNEEQHPVLPKPSNGRNSTDLYSKQHEVS